MHWHVDGADLNRVFVALPGLVGAGALLGLADGAWPEELRRFLDAWSVEPEPEAIGAMPTEFECAKFLPIDDCTMAALTDIARLLPACEVCIHLIAIRGSLSLVE